MNSHFRPQHVLPSNASTSNQVSNSLAGSGATGAPPRNSTRTSQGSYPVVCKMSFTVVHHIVNTLTPVNIKHCIRTIEHGPIARALGGY
jgi:hypothetical protein